MIAQICDHVAHGVHIGNCVDRLFVLSCCKISKSGRFGKPSTNITHTNITPTRNSNADSNKTAETAKENFPEVEPLDEILNAPSISSLNWKPESLDIKIINTTANDDIVSELSNQHKVPVNEQIMKDYLTLLLSYYEHLYGFQLNTTQNKNGTKSQNNTEIPIQKIPSENPDNKRTSNHHDNINFRQYVINNHAQSSPTQGIKTDTSQSEIEIIFSLLKNYVKNNCKKSTNSKPIISQKLNNDSNAISSTISPSNSTNNESESLFKVNISATSYPLLNENVTLPSSSESTPNVSLNSTKLPDIHFSMSTTKPTTFEPVNSLSDTTLLPSDVTTASDVYVSTNISEPSLDISKSYSINATESLHEASISKTLYPSANETTLSDTTHSFEETFELEKIASLIENIIKYYYKYKTNIKPLNQHMPHQPNDESSIPSSTISPSKSINNQSDLLYKVNVSATPYSALYEGTTLPTSSVSTSNESQNSTKFTDLNFSMPATKPTLFETVNKTPQTVLPQKEVTTQTLGYVSNNTSLPSLIVFLSSSNNSTDSLYDAKFSNTLYSSVKGATYSNTTEQYEEKLKLKNITSLLRDAVKNYYKNYTNAKPVTPPNPYKVNDERNMLSSNVYIPTHSITNESESLNKVNISATTYFLLNEDKTLPTFSVKTSNVLFNSTELPDLYSWRSSSKPESIAQISSPSDTTLLQREVSIPSPIYITTNISAPSWDENHNAESSEPSSTVSPSNSIKKEYDSLNIANNLGTSYSLLKAYTFSPDTSISTSKVLFNSTNFSDFNLGGSSSKQTSAETDSSPPETTFLHTYVTTPSPVYVSTNISESSGDDKFNEDSSVPSSTVSSNSINSDYVSLNKLNISATSYSLIDADTSSTDTSKSTNNALFNSTNLSDLYVWESSSIPVSTDTNLFTSDATTPSAVDVSTKINAPAWDDELNDDISGTSSTVSTSNSINNEHNLQNKVNMSDTSYSLLYKDIYPPDISTRPLPANEAKNTSVPSWNDKLNDGSSLPSSTVSPSNFINNEYDSLKKVNISAASLLNQDYSSPNISAITSNVLFNSTNLPYLYFSESPTKPSSSEPVSSHPDTTLLQSDVSTQSPVYVSANLSSSIWDDKLNNDSSVPSSTVSLSNSIKYEYDSLNKVNILSTPYSFLNEDTFSPDTLRSNSNVLFNSTNVSDLYIWRTSTEPTSSEPVCIPPDTNLLQRDVTTPSPVYVSTKISVPSMDDKLNNDSSVHSSTVSPSNSFNNEGDSQNKINISATSYSLLNKDRSSSDILISTSDGLFKSINLFDLYLWWSSKRKFSKPVNNPPDTPLLQSDVTTLSSVYASTNRSELSWNDKHSEDSSGLLSTVAQSNSNNGYDSGNKVNISTTSYSYFNEDISFTYSLSNKDSSSPDTSPSTSNVFFNSTNLSDLYFWRSSSKPTSSESVSSLRDTTLLQNTTAPSPVYVSTNISTPSWNDEFNDDSSVPLSTLLPSGSINSEYDSLKKVNISATSYSLLDEDTSSPHTSPSNRNNLLSISVNNATDMLLESSISNTLYSLKNETKSYDNLDSESNLSLNITKHLDPDILISSLKPTILEPVSSIINTSPLSNKSFTPFVMLVLRINGALSSTTSVSYYNSIRPDATVKDSLSFSVVP